MGKILKRVQEVKETVDSSPDNDLSFVTRNISVDSVVSTGSTVLDLCISGKRRRGGGLPGGVIVEAYGPSASGKSALLAETCASVQRLGGTAKVQDPEGRLDREYARIYGLNLNVDDYDRPDKVEEIFAAIRSWKPKDPSKINIVGTDSLAALSTELEMTKGDKMGMKRAKEFSAGFRVIARQIVNKNWIMFCTNQIRQGDYGETTPGGEAVKFYSSLRLRVTQADILYKEIAFDGTESEDEDEGSGGKKKKLKKAIGIESTVFVKKSTIDDPYRECTVFFVFGYGIDDIRGNLQYCKEMMGLSKYPCPDGRSYGPINMAIKHIESDNLQNDLKEQTIDLWEEIEKKFDSKRVPKVR